MSHGTSDRFETMWVIAAAVTVAVSATAWRVLTADTPRHHRHVTLLAAAFAVVAVTAIAVRTL